MPEEQRIIEACAEALKMARSFVVDGRGALEDVERTLAQVDAALDLAANYFASPD